MTKVHQHLRQKHLIGVRRDGVLVVPKIFFDDKGHVVKSLPGLLVVLHDGGYGETEIVRWLFTPDPSLTISRDGATEAQPNARPVDALHSPSGARGGAPRAGDGLLRRLRSRRRLGFGRLRRLGQRVPRRHGARRGESDVQPRVHAV